ncbi:hypothetical protein [Neisseria musculi]|uniref:Uncharacterized protein n=1 Tax=Neisseria musculi TaxID=1815583 RepID=A0A7H1M9Z4_9NEIS|nr:hypothetical protein [Neisseria musculi]QNT58459.1 hypothetical protein H7A79_1420 [Neisseria musculi]
MASKNEERKLLEMQAELARLKITAARLKMQRARERKNMIDTGFNTVLSLADNAPPQSLLWKSLLLPLSWKHRIFAAAGLLLWQVWRQDGKR